jgi:uncharacterized protein
MMKSLLPRLCLGLLLAIATAAVSGCLLDPGPERKIQFDYDRKLLSLPPNGQALAIAAEMGDVEEIRRLMKDEGVDPDGMFSPEGFPLLAWPIYTRNPAGLKAMLENGADPNARFPEPYIDRATDGSILRTGYKNNAMVWAAKAEDPIYLKLLLDHGGDPNTRNSNNETLLHQAFIWQNQWENVKLLVERGADVNLKTRGQPIITDYASGGGFMQAYWLLEHGADPDNDSPDPKFKSTINAIFWHPGNPDDATWQRKCQQWLLARGYKRPPMTERYRDMRKNFGFPHEEKDIPLL